VAQLDADQYIRLTPEHTYGRSDGLYWDRTNSLLVLVINDAIVMSLDSTGAILGGALEAGDLNVAGQARGDLLRRGASAWERLAAATSGRILVGDGTDIASVAVSGDATLSAAGALTVADVTVGSDAAGDLLYKSSATALARLAKGTAGQTLRMNAGATAPTWSDDLARALSEDFNALDTTDQVALVLPSGAVADGATGVVNHLYSPGGNIYCCASLGAGQTIFPNIVAAGLDIGGDQADDEGWEIWSHFAGATGRPFIVGKDPAFYFLCKIVFGDADGLDHLMIGLRRAGPHLATMGDIQDYASFGVSTAADPMALKLLTGLNGTDTNTDTTETFVGTTAVQFKVLVSAAGVVTFQHDIVTPGTLAAPSATVALTLDNGDPMIPFVRFLNVAAFADSVVIHKWEAGPQ
jgi:hypothetical protein